MIKLLASLLLVLAITSCGESSHEPIVYPAVQPTHEETKQTLEEIEKANPLNYLNVTGSYRKNFIGQWVVEGTINNKASVATYKDVVIDIVYLSKTGTEVGRIQRTIFEFIKPNGAFDFKFKTDGFSGTDHVNCGIAGATAK